MLGLEGYSVKSAFFRDSARTVVEVVWEHESTKEKGFKKPLPDQVEYINAAIDSNGKAAEASSEWNNLLKYIDIDTLHKNTGNYIQQQKKAFELQVEEIASRKGMLFNSDNKHQLVEALFKNNKISEQAETKENLFLYKLQLFELPEIKASKDRPTKALLRKSENLMSATKYAIKLFEDQEALNKTQED